ncbi:hypothetical protein [Rhizobium sp. GCM10022189]|uniref:hypothetical protein n=1 Tax=Rhizobium sp. GCM10022189 TaxID=3252654 RepID=UPI0036226329
MRNKRLLAAGLIAALTVLSSCAANPNSLKMSESAKAAGKRAQSMVQEKGAAAVVRVSWDGVYCARGRVRLQKVVDGRIDPGPFVEIGQPTGVYGNAALKDFAKLSLQMMTFNLPAVAKAAAVEDIRTSFRAIESGRYIITMVYCDNGNNNAAMGSANLGWMGENGDKPQIPLLGDNSIVIGQGEIVDAGIVDIVSTGSTGFLFGRDTARLAGSEAPQPMREAMKLNLPEVYARTTYTRFSAYSGLLLPESPQPKEK